MFSSLDRLASIWDEMGVAEAERTQHLELLGQELANTYREAVDRQHNSKDRIEQSIYNIIRDIRGIYSLMQATVPEDRMVYPPDTCLTEQLAQIQVEMLTATKVSKRGVSYGTTIHTPCVNTLGASYYTKRTNLTSTNHVGTNSARPASYTRTVRDKTPLILRVSLFSLPHFAAQAITRGALPCEHCHSEHALERAGPGAGRGLRRDRRGPVDIPHHRDWPQD
jgi:hypothetical protein